MLQEINIVPRKEEICGTCVLLLWELCYKVNSIPTSRPIGQNQGKNALLERRTLVEAKFMARLKWIKAKVYLLADVGIKSKDWVL